MRGPVSRTGIVTAIVRKDLREFARDRLWLVLTTLGLVMFVAVFWVLPDTVDETIRVGVYPADLADALLALEAGEGDGQTGRDTGKTDAGQGLAVVPFGSLEELRAVVGGATEGEGEAADVVVGLAFPPDFAARVARGEDAAVTVFVQGGVPVEVRDAMQSAVREIAYLAAASAAGDDAAAVVPVRMSSVVLGEDRAGRQVSMRERMRPLLAFFVLMMESMTLASLIAVEVQRRTVTALLVTPARLSDVLAAKTLLGTSLAFGQTVLLLALMRSLGDGWSVLLVAALLGAVMATGTALISGAAGKDFIGTLFLGMALLLPLAIPAVTVLLPGSTALWVRALPTYGVIKAFVGVTAYDESWADLWRVLMLAAVWCVALLATGLAVLRRRVRTL